MPEAAKINSKIGEFSKGRVSSACLFVWRLTEKRLSAPHLDTAAKKNASMKSISFRHKLGWIRVLGRQFQVAAALTRCRPRALVVVNRPLDGYSRSKNVRCDSLYFKGRLGGLGSFFSSRAQQRGSATVGAKGVG